VGVDKYPSNNYTDDYKSQPDPQWFRSSSLDWGHTVEDRMLGSNLEQFKAQTCSLGTMVWNKQSVSCVCAMWDVLTSHNCSP
jgi:hypothetical protein